MGKQNAASGPVSTLRRPQELERTGIQRSDPRLENMMRMLKALKPHALASVEELKLEIGTFKTVLSENVVLVTKALQNQMIIPAFEAFCENIRQIYEKVNIRRRFCNFCFYFRLLLLHLLLLFRCCFSSLLLLSEGDLSFLPPVQGEHPRPQRGLHPPAGRVRLGEVRRLHLHHRRAEVLARGRNDAIHYSIDEVKVAQHFGKFKKYIPVTS